MRNVYISCPNVLEFHTGHGCAFWKCLSHCEIGYRQTRYREIWVENEFLWDVLYCNRPCTLSVTIAMVLNEKGWRRMKTATMTLACCVFCIEIVYGTFRYVFSYDILFSGVERPQTWRLDSRTRTLVLPRCVVCYAGLHHHTTLLRDCFYHIGVEAKWTPLGRRYFQTHYVKWKNLNCQYIFTEACSFGSN